MKGRGFHICARALGLVLGAIFLTTCKSKPQEPHPAALAAKNSYEDLLQGKVEQWVDAHHFADSIPPAYRAQMLDLARMHRAELQQEHGGLRVISIDTCQVDSARNVANAVLAFHFADSTVERVAVPMVMHRSMWLLR